MTWGYRNDTQQAREAKIETFCETNGSEKLNSKITALFAVAVMVTAGCVLVADTAGTDAKVVPNGGTAETILIKEGVSHNVTLYTDEYQYSNYGYKLTWYIAKNTNNYTTQADLDKISFDTNDKLGDRINTSADGYTSSSVTIGSVQFTLTERKYTNGFNNVGEYNLNIFANTDVNSPGTDVNSPGTDVNSPGNIVIKCEVSVKLNDIESYPVESLYYLYTVNVETAKTYVLKGMTFYEGVNVSEKIIADDDTPDNELTIDNYDWYATGLPSGLSMNRDGTITGTPHESASSVPSVKVVGTLISDTSVVVNATLSVTIEEGSTANIALSITGTGSDVVTIDENVSYAVEANSKGVELIVGLSSENQLPYDVLTVRIVDNNGNIKVIDDSAKPTTSFDISSYLKGTGFYQIYVTSVVDSETQIDAVGLYVIGNLDSVFAEIIVSGA